MEEGLKTLFNVTFYHKHDKSVVVYNDDYKLYLECQFSVKGREYTFEINSSDLVKHKISNIAGIIEFIAQNVYDIHHSDNLHILVITSDEVMKELAESFSVFDYYKVLSIIQKV